MKLREEHMPVPGETPTAPRLPIVRIVTEYADTPYPLTWIEAIDADGTSDPGIWEYDQFGIAVQRAMERSNTDRVLVERVTLPAPEDWP